MQTGPTLDSQYPSISRIPLPPPSLRLARPLDGTTCRDRDRFPPDQTRRKEGRTGRSPTTYAESKQDTGEWHP